MGKRGERRGEKEWGCVMKRGVHAQWLTGQ